MPDIASADFHGKLDKVCDTNAQPTTLRFARSKITVRCKISIKMIFRYLISVFTISSLYTIFPANNTFQANFSHHSGYPWA